MYGDMMDPQNKPMPSLNNFNRVEKGGEYGPWIADENTGKKAHGGVVWKCHSTKTGDIGYISERTLMQLYKKKSQARKKIDITFEKELFKKIRDAAKQENLSTQSFIVSEMRKIMDGITEINPVNSVDAPGKNGGRRGNKG